MILSLSTGVPGNRRRTVPMIPTYTGSVIRRASSTSACTPCATPTPHEPSRAACSRKFCRSCWATPASRRPWTAMSTSPRSRWTRLCGNLKPTVLRNPSLLKKWCKNGTVSKGPGPQTVANTGFFKARYVYMKLGIVGLPNVGKVNAVQRHHQRRSRKRQLPLLHHRAQRGHGGRAGCSGWTSWRRCISPTKRPPPSSNLWTLRAW